MFDLFGRKRKLLIRLESLLREQRRYLKQINQQMGPSTLQLYRVTWEGEQDTFSLKTLEGSLWGLARAIREELNLPEPKDGEL